MLFRSYLSLFFTHFHGYFAPKMHHVLPAESCGFAIMGSSNLFTIPSCQTRGMKKCPAGEPFGNTEQLPPAGQRCLIYSSVGGFRAFGSACESPTSPVSLAKSGSGAAPSAPQRAQSMNSRKQSIASVRPRRRRCVRSSSTRSIASVAGEDPRTACDLRLRARRYSSRVLGNAWRLPWVSTSLGLALAW